MKIVGFTGTRNGLTEQQQKIVRGLFEFVEISELHHGACFGADAEAVEIIGRMREGGWVCRIVAHPGDRGALSSQPSLAASDEVLPCRPMLERNRHIVDASGSMIACPAEMQEEQRSGTWATIRYARKRKKDIAIVWPDGTITNEAWGSAGGDELGGEGG